MIHSTFSMMKCPLCGESFSLSEHSLICPNRHTYDIARQGYVNFVPAQKETFYKEGLFKSRARVFESGLFAPVVQTLSDAISYYAEEREEPPVVLDAGCGEGFYTKAVCAGDPMVRMGFDLSRDAIKLAARGPKQAMFFVADLGHIPLKDHTVDVLLDIFTPANYAEFKRVLKQDGLVMKLAPRHDYLIQLRQLAGDQLRRTDYDGGDVERYAHSKMQMVDQRIIHYTMPVTPELAGHLARMTPMMAGVDVDALDLEKITEITIDETLYIGKIA